MNVVLTITDEQVELIARRAAEIVSGGRDAAPRDVPGWLTILAASKYLSIPPDSLRKLIAARKIPYYQAEKGCRITLRRSDLDEWMHASRRERRGAA